MTTNKAPIVKGSMATLTERARDIMNSFGIHVKRTKAIKVMITQHCVTGTSFTFMTHDKEYHLPSRLVADCFQEVPQY